MNLTTTLIAALFLTGCASTQSRSKIDAEVKVVLKSAFENENNYPPERNVLRLRGHALNLEEMLRDVRWRADEKRIAEVLVKYFQRYGKDLIEAKQNLELIVIETGCSKALLMTLIRETRDINFEFFVSRGCKLNPRYSYSQLILDERATTPVRFHTP